MIPLPPSITIAIGAVFLVAAFASGWSVKGWKDDAARLEEQRITQEAIENERKRADQVAAGWAAAAESLRAQERTRIVEVTKEVEKPVYRDCVVPDSGRMLLDAALSATGTASKPVATLPGTPPASGQ